MKNEIKTEVKRINGYLKEITTFLDSSGKPVSHIINPVMTELRPRDVFQIFVGTMIFGSPLCYAEDIWILSKQISFWQVGVLNSLGFILLASFVYFNFYRFKFKGNIVNFIKRVFAIYVICFGTIATFLFLIGKLPVHDVSLCFNRVSLISFPSLFSAVISDMLK